MLNLPKSTEYGSRIPKKMFYENLDVPPEIKRLFVDQIRIITWTNKLSPETMNIAAGQTVQEIEVFLLKLSGVELDSRVPTLIDKQIPYHIIYLLESSEGLFRLLAAYKEQSSGKNAFQIKKSYTTDWKTLTELSLPVSALDMDRLYEELVRQIAGERLTSEGESLKDVVEHTEEQERLQRQIETLKAKMYKEPHLSRQMGMRREIKKLEQKLEEFL